MELSPFVKDLALSKLHTSNILSNEGEKNLNLGIIGSHQACQNCVGVSFVVD